jgi:hypothetical protein
MTANLHVLTPADEGIVAATLDDFADRGDDDTVAGVAEALEAVNLPPAAAFDIAYQIVITDKRKF